MSTAPIINQKEYLKKYLNLGNDENKKKKKKKKLKTAQNRVKIIDDNIDIINSETIAPNELDEFLTQEDAPQVVGVIDDRPLELRLDDYRKNSKWKLVGSDDEETKRNQEQSSKRGSERDLSPNRSKYDSGNSSSQKNRSRKRSDSDESPPRRGRSPRDSSPPRKNRDKSPDSDASPPRRSRHKNLDSDTSPPRKNRNRSPDLRRNRKNYDSDPSPPRKNKMAPKSPERRKRSPDFSPKRNRKNYDSDHSPPRKIKREPLSPDSSPKRNKKIYDSDCSPPRKIKREPDSPPRRNRSPESPRRRKRTDSDASPPRRNKDRSPSFDNRQQRNYSNSDSSSSRNKSRSNLDDKPKKKSRWADSTPDPSPPRSTSSSKPDLDKPGPSKKMVKTLDGKKAGLQNAKELMAEIESYKQRENDLFNKMAAQSSNSNAPVIRDRKTGRKRDFEREAIEEFEKMRKEQAQKEKYDRWGKGLKQVENIKEKIESELHEMSKPLARYADDEDLERHLKEQERDGDPMLAYIKKKKRQHAVGAGKPMRPMYQGEFMPNRFNIPPGHRWDGVDRSNDFEKKWFDKQNAKKAMEEEIYKWSTEDM